MNFKLMETLLVGLTILSICVYVEPIEVVKGNKNATRTKPGIMKAFLMQCSGNVDTFHRNIQVIIQIGEHSMTESLAKTNNDSIVGRILIGEISGSSNGNYACDLRKPSIVEVSNENYVLMYPLKIETLKVTSEIHTLDAISKKTDSAKGTLTHGVKKTKDFNHLDADKDVHNANNMKLFNDIYYTGLKPSDFRKRSDFMHTNPKDFRSDSICTKNLRKDNNKNNANNEYANEEFYGDKNQRENGNAFSGKFRVNLNEIDNLKSVKQNANVKHIINDIGYFTKNWFDDKDSRQRRKNIEEHKNDFIKCVGMKNFKKIDHVLCTCARYVDGTNEDETENDEQSDCLQLINNVCLWGPVYNKNINYEMKMNEDRRNVNYGGITSTAFACCDLLPPFYLALGNKCFNRFMKEENYDDLYDETDKKWPEITKTKLLDAWPEIIKNESDEIIDKTMSIIHSNIEKNEKISKNKFYETELKSLLNLPKYHFHSDNGKRHKNKQIKNRIDNERLVNVGVVPLYDIDDTVEIIKKPLKHHKFHKKEALPFDKVIYDPHLNIADKMQLINSITPKRPCERNRMNNARSLHDHRQKRTFEISDQSSLTDDELDSALEDYEFEYPGLNFQNDLLNKKNFGIYDPKQYFNDKSVAINNEETSVRKMQNICSLHPCALAMPFKKDPYFRGEIKFLDNNGSSLSSTEIAENICRDHFNEFILIPVEYANIKAT